MSDKGMPSNMGEIYDTGNNLKNLLMSSLGNSNLKKKYHLKKNDNVVN